MFGCTPLYGPHDEYDPLGEPPELILKEKKSVSDKPIKVRVIDRWQVIHDGKPYNKGQEVTVPEHIADEWERSGWVERVTTKEKS